MRGNALGRLLARRPLPDLSALAARHTGRVALVGGSIRDALLGRTPADVDLIVERGLEAFLVAVEGRRGRPAAPIGDRFQDTHRMRWAGLQVDIARSLGTIEEDLERRDFTVNAMAVELPAGEGGEVAVLDPHGGLRDLDAGLLRETGPGVLATDPLRALRAVRYALSLPGFVIERATRDAVREAALNLDAVAAERRCAEWSAILELPRWATAVELARELGVTASLGALDDIAAVRAWAAGESADGETGAEASTVPRLAALLLDLAGQEPPAVVGERLVRERWPRRLLRSAVRAAAWATDPGPSPEVMAERALEDADAATDAAELAARLARQAGEQPPEWAARLARYADRAREPRWVRGRDLLEIGFEPGPQVGRLVRSAASGQVRRCWSDRAAALAWARDQCAGGAP